MISKKVMLELHQARLVPTQFTVPKPGEHAWSAHEQKRFWDALHVFPEGPWTAIAAYIGTKSTRQAMTHAQKLRQKLDRWKRRVKSINKLAADTGSAGSSVDPNELMMDDEEQLQDEPDAESVPFESETTVEFDDHTNRASASSPIANGSLGLRNEPSHEVADDDDDHLDLDHLDLEPVLTNVASFSSSDSVHYQYQSHRSRSQACSTEAYMDAMRVHHVHRHSTSSPVADNLLMKNEEPSASQFAPVHHHHLHHHEMYYAPQFHHAEPVPFLS